MKMNYNEKIEKIDNDRIIMLSMLKEKAIKDKENLSINMSEILKLLKIEEENHNEYKSIIKSKELIMKLTEEIQNANDIEEIKKLRNKLNYYINKIKKELAKRNINNDIVDNMYNQVAYLRKDISSYISYLKRQSNIDEIKYLYKNIDNIPIEEIKKLKNKLEIETKYNRNNIKKLKNKSLSIENDNKISSNITTIEKKLKEKDKNTIEEIIYEISNIKGSNEKESETNILNSIYKEIEILSSNSESKLTLAEKTKNISLLDKANSYKERYDFKELNKYNKNFLGNFLALLKNIPIYNWNKKATKRLKADYEMYYRGKDLNSYIAYSKKRNSIKTALATIFKNSRLTEREKECLYNHDYCVEWITEFYKQNNQSNNKAIKLQR